MAKDVFGFEDRIYFDNPMSQLELIRDSLEDAHKNVVLTGGPGWVSLDKEKKFPYVALRVTESPIAHALPFKEYAVIASWDASSNRLFAELFVEQKFAKIKRDPSIIPPPGKYSDGGALDLFARKIVPVSEGDFYNTVIVQGAKSNRVRTLVGPSGFEKDVKGFEAFLEGKQFKSEVASGVGKDLIPKSISSGNGLPANSVVITIKPGKGENREQQNPTFHIDYSLLHRRPMESASRPPKSNSMDPLYFGLLATGSKTPSPLVWRAAVSVQPEGVSEDGQVRGGFSLSMEQLKGIEPGQVYYFYAFSGTEMSEPAIFDFASQP